MNIKSQSAIEFVTLAAFMFFVIVGFFAITTSKILESKDQANSKIAEGISDYVNHEVETAKSVNDGYSRTFELPQTVNGIDYGISIIDNRELVVNYLGYEHVRFLNATGNITKGDNKIYNRNGIVFINQN